MGFQSGPALVLGVPGAQCAYDCCHSGPLSLPFLLPLLAHLKLFSFYFFPATTATSSRACWGMAWGTHFLQITLPKNGRFESSLKLAGSVGFEFGFFKSGQIMGSFSWAGRCSALNKAFVMGHSLVLKPSSSTFDHP